MNSIITWALKNSLLVLLLCILLSLTGLWALKNTAVDALPDLSDPQVILTTSSPGLSPRLIEDQITYPLSQALLSVPGAKTVRGYSLFGTSMVYVIFAEGTDLYWARTRVQEIAASSNVKLPPGVKASLGPDATGLGWVFEYALVSQNHSLAELRSLQDWQIRTALASVSGVAEVASIGGAVKEVQIRLNPAALQSYGLSLSTVMNAVQNANGDVGGESIEQGETEFMIQAKGYLQNLDQVRQIPLKSQLGQQVHLSDVASVDWGPAMRRGSADLGGEGEVAGGIVVMRNGENALRTIENVKAKLREIQASLPQGVEIVPTYDRTTLIQKAIQHLSFKLLEEMAIVALVCALFLMHFRAALVAMISLPLSLLMAFLVMKLQGVNANLMSLGGLAIAIGAMVDAAIIFVENALKHLEHNQAKPEAQRQSHFDLILEACKEVGPALFWSLSLITISFLPIFALSEQEGRLFIPLALTKTYAMAAAAMFSITLVPVLMLYLLRGKIPAENRNPINRFLIALYTPFCHAVLRSPKRTILLSLGLLGLSFYPLQKLGTEFMPPLNEGDLLYMPTTMPGISITKSKEILRRTDSLILRVPEVKQVFGKAGRAESATDPAGLDMLETVIQLRDKSEWRPGMNIDKIIAELDSTVQIPGLTNAWTMPIKARIDMLSTGIKTPLGLKISGPNLDTLQHIGLEAEKLLRNNALLSAVFAERTVGGNYLEAQIKREVASQYGLPLSSIQEAISIGLGGEKISTWVEGLERYNITVRYARDYRQDLGALKQIPVFGPTGIAIPLGELVEFKYVKGPMVLRTEDSRPNAWVFVDSREKDFDKLIDSCRSSLKELKLPVGYELQWSGQYESIQRAKERLGLIIPITLLLMVILLYLNTQSMKKTALVLMAVPFSLIGAFWTLYFLDYQLSVAVAVGLIALAGLDAETGVIMLLYLENALKKAKDDGRLGNLTELKEALFAGAVLRVRPKIMTATVILAGLLPILWSDGTGADLMKRIAAPMVGGVISSVLMELLFYPAVVYLWKGRRLK